MEGIRCPECGLEMAKRLDGWVCPVCRHEEHQSASHLNPRLVPLLWLGLVIMVAASSIISFQYLNGNREKEMVLLGETEVDDKYPVYVQFSPDGNSILTTSQFQVPKLRDAEDLSLSWRLGIGPRVQDNSQVWFSNPAQIEEMNSSHRGAKAVFSKDGHTLATCGTYAVTAWDMAGDQSLRQLGTTEPITTFISDFAVSPDSRYLVSSTAPGRKAMLWELPSCRLVTTVDKRLIQYVAISPDESFFVTGGSDSAKLWSIPEGNLLATLKGHDRAVHSISFSPSGEYMATAQSSDHTVLLWKVPEGELVCTLPGHEKTTPPPSRGCPTEFSADGRLLAAYCRDRSVKVWRVPEGELVAMYGTEVAPVYSAKFNLDGSLLALGRKDGEVQLCETSSGKLALSATSGQDLICSIAFSPDGRLLATGDTEGMIYKWELPVTGVNYYYLAVGPVALVIVAGFCWLLWLAWQIARLMYRKSAPLLAGVKASATTGFQRVETAAAPEIGAWAAAWRRLPDNPIVLYLMQAATRRNQKTPAWKRYLFLVITMLLITIGTFAMLAYQSVSPGTLILVFLTTAGILFFTYLLTGGRHITQIYGIKRRVLVLGSIIPAAAILLFVIASPNLSPGFSQIHVAQYAYGILGVLTYAYIIFAIGRIHSVVVDALRVLAIPQHRQPELVLDNMLSITAIDDRDIVLGAHSALAPKLWLISLQGTLLIWVGAVLAVSSGSSNPWGFVLVSPFAAGALVLSGCLGGSILVLLLMCLGRGRNPRIAATFTGAVASIGHFLYPLVPVVLMAIAALGAALFGGAGSSLGPATVPAELVIAFLGYRLLAALLFSAAYYAFLAWAVRHPQRAILNTHLALFLLAVGFLQLGSLPPQIAGSSILGFNLVQVVYYQSWGSLMVINPWAWPTAHFLSSGSSTPKNLSSIMFLGAVIMVIQQLIMFWISLQMARRAVHTRRHEFN